MTQPTDSRAHPSRARACPTDTPRDEHGTGGPTRLQAAAPVEADAVPPWLRAPVMAFAATAGAAVGLLATGLIGTTEAPAAAPSAPTLPRTAPTGAGHGLQPVSHRPALGAGARPVPSAWSALLPAHDTPLPDAMVTPAAPDASVDATLAALPVLPAAVPRGPDGRILAPRDMEAPRLPRLKVVAVAEPSDIDADGQGRSATEAPATVSGPGTLAGRGHGLAAGQTPAGPDASSGSGSAARATDDGAHPPADDGDRDAANDSDRRAAADGDLPGHLQAAATAPTSYVYTPAQIRQAYGFAALPASTAANKGVYQGSGQMIVIVNAFHNATVAQDLNTFSAKFGLPPCVAVATPYNPGAQPGSLVPPPKPGDGCTIQTVYVNAAGRQSATPPRVDSGWGMEIALDVQWVHAIAPLAKIVLIEAASSSAADLMNAMAYAAQLNASTVSMSFGAGEFASAPAYDGIMGGSATWVAASGDWGAGVMWPAMSQRVLGVGGTYLSNLSPRAETGWSGSGGGLSRYVARPTWQAGVGIPGTTGLTARRAVPDVGYNASPSSGHYVVYGGNWYSVGGTSAGTPQWAALVALTNGARAAAGKARFGGTSFQQALYGTLAAPSVYKANFLDVTSGANGTCATCKAVVGYDLVTGLGTPQVASLVNSAAALR